MFSLDISKRILKSVRIMFKLHNQSRIITLSISFPTAKIMRHWSRFWRILTIFLDTHLVEPNQRYQNLFVLDKNSFKTSRMIQNYIFKRFWVQKINFGLVLRFLNPYWTVKIDSFLTDFRKLAQAPHTSPFGPRIYLEGFSDPINSFKPFPGHFEQFKKKRFFGLGRVRTRTDGGLTSFPRQFFQIFRLDI